MIHLSTTENKIMKAKTDKVSLQAIEQFETIRDHINDVLKVKADFPEHCLSEHLKKTNDYYDGYMIGVMTMTESILHRQRCYYGYQNIDTKGNVISISQNLDEFREWRKDFIVRK